MALQNGRPVEHRGTCRHDRPDRPHRPTYPYSQRFLRTMWAWCTDTTSDVIVRRRKVSRHDGLETHRAGDALPLLEAAPALPKCPPSKDAEARRRIPANLGHNFRDEFLDSTGSGNTHDPAPIAPKQPSNGTVERHSDLVSEAPVCGGQHLARDVFRGGCGRAIQSGLDRPKPGFRRALLRDCCRSHSLTCSRLDQARSPKTQANVKDDYTISDRLRHPVSLWKIRISPKFPLRSQIR